jgi:hypothetical protein
LGVLTPLTSFGMTDMGTGTKRLLGEGEATALTIFCFGNYRR